MQQNDSIVIIPTYNEKENIEAIIRAVTGLQEHAFDILIIDDGSPDGTADIVKRLMAEEVKDRVFRVERQGKLGLGRICRGSTRLVPKKATTWRSAAATFLG